MTEELCRQHFEAWIARVKPSHAESIEDRWLGWLAAVEWMQSRAPAGGGEAVAEPSYIEAWARRLHLADLQLAGSVERARDIIVQVLAASPPSASPPMTTEQLRADQGRALDTDDAYMMFRDCGGVATEWPRFKSYLERVASPPPATAPAGWQLVPVEPTDAMLVAALNTIGCELWAAGLTYRAMLAAAPPPPAAQADAGRVDVVRKALEIGLSFASSQAKEYPVSSAFNVQLMRDALDAIAALSTPTPASHAATDVLAERQRQISVEGWTPEHDDEHTFGEMARAAACYAVNDRNLGDGKSFVWPASWLWKPKDRRSNLVRATALMLAEIERRDRAATPTGAK